MPKLGSISLSLLPLITDLITEVHRKITINPFYSLLRDKSGKQSKNTPNAHCHHSLPLISLLYLPQSSASFLQNFKTLIQPNHFQFLIHLIHLALSKRAYQRHKPSKVEYTPEGVYCYVLKYSSKINFLWARRG